MTVNEQQVLTDIVNKWERYKLYQPKNVRHPDVRYGPDFWLMCEMKPTIDAARKLLGRKPPTEFY